MGELVWDHLQARAKPQHVRAAEASGAPRRPGPGIARRAASSFSQSSPGSKRLFRLERCAGIVFVDGYTLPNASDIFRPPKLSGREGQIRFRVEGRLGRFQGALPGTPSARIVSIRCNWHTAWRKSANASPGRPPGRWTDACRANRRKAGPARENPCTRTESGGPGPWPPNFPPEGPEQQGLRRAPFLLVAFVPQVGRASATLDMSDSSPRHCVLHRWGGSAREVRGVPTCRRLRPPQRGSNGAGPSGPAGGGALAALPHRRRLLGRGGGQLWAVALCTPLPATRRLGWCTCGMRLGTPGG